MERPPRLFLAPSKEAPFVAGLRWSARATHPLSEFSDYVQQLFGGNAFGGDPSHTSAAKRIVGEIESLLISAAPGGQYVLAMGWLFNTLADLIDHKITPQEVHAMMADSASFLEQARIGTLSMHALGNVNADEHSATHPVAESPPKVWLRQTNRASVPLEWDGNTHGWRTPDVSAYRITSFDGTHITHEEPVTRVLTTSNGEKIVRIGDERYYLRTDVDGSNWRIYHPSDSKLPDIPIGPASRKLGEPRGKYAPQVVGRGDISLYPRIENENLIESAVQRLPDSVTEDAIFQNGLLNIDGTFYVQGDKGYYPVTYDERYGAYMVEVEKWDIKIKVPMRYHAEEGEWHPILTLGFTAAGRVEPGWSPTSPAGVARLAAMRPAAVTERFPAIESRMAEQDALQSNADDVEVAQEAEQAFMPSGLMISHDIDNLFRADLRSPSELLEQGGFGASYSFNDVRPLFSPPRGVLITSEQSAKVEQFIKTDIVPLMPHDEFWFHYSIDSKGLEAVSVNENAGVPALRHFIRKPIDLAEAHLNADVPIDRIRLLDTNHPALRRALNDLYQANPDSYRRGVSLREASRLVDLDAAAGEGAMAGSSRRHRRCVSMAGPLDLARSQDDQGSVGGRWTDLITRSFGH